MTSVRSGARWLAVLGLVAWLGGCQLVDRSADLAPNSPGSSAAEEPLGSPEDDFPSTLGGLLAFTQPEALTWQDAPVLTDVTVWLDPQGSWERVRVGYVAAEADRFLTLRADPERLRLERPLFEGLQLLPLPQAAVDALVPLPDGTLEPAALGVAAGDGLGQCEAGAGPVRAVLYSTGAPAAWDGDQWSTAPLWRATVFTTLAGVTVDPVSGAATTPLTCVDPVGLDEA